MRKLMIVLAAFAVPAVYCASASADDPGRSFEAKCASCHGKDGKGKTKQGEKMKVADMTTPEFRKEWTKDKIKTAILDGIDREKDGVKQEMKPFKGKLSEDQLEAITAYVLGLK